MYNQYAGTFFNCFLNAYVDPFQRTMFLFLILVFVGNHVVQGYLHDLTCISLQFVFFSEMTRTISTSVRPFRLSIPGEVCRHHLLMSMV